MFYGQNYDFLSMFVYFIAVALLYGISFLLVINYARIELKRNESLYIVAVSIPCLLIPGIGPILTFFSTVALTHHIGKIDYGIAAGAVTITWFFTIVAFLLAIGLSRLLMVI